MTKNRFTNEYKKTDKHQVQSYLENLKIKLSTEMKDCKFKLEPEPFSIKVSDKKIHTSKKNIEFQCNMKQILANTNNASTGHKLQGMSKDVITVTSWPTGGLASMFKNGSMLSYPVCTH